MQIETERQRQRATLREKERERERQTDRQTDRDRERDRERETDRERERERQTDRQTDRQRQRQRESQRERETDRENFCLKSKITTLFYRRSVVVTYTLLLSVLKKKSDGINLTRAQHHQTAAEFIKHPTDWGLALSKAQRKYIIDDQME